MLETDVPRGHLVTAARSRAAHRPHP